MFVPFTFYFEGEYKVVRVCLSEDCCDERCALHDINRLTLLSFFLLFVSELLGAGVMSAPARSRLLGLGHY